MINFIAFISVVLMVAILIIMSIYYFLTEAINKKHFSFKMFFSVVLMVIAIIGLYFNSIIQ